MSYKIACPHCQHGLSIKDPKPGEYKPKCSGCGEQFAIVVEPGDPSQIKVGKIPSPPGKPTPENPPNNPASVRSKPEIASGSKVNETEATIGLERSIPSHQSRPSVRATGLEATAIEEPTKPSNKRASDPVMDTIGMQSLQPASPISKDFSVNEATLEGPSSQSQPVPMQSESTSEPTAVAASAEAIKPAIGVPHRLGGYKILSDLGAGGMGSVYLARQISLDRPCALKTIQAHWAQNPRVIARFIREAYAAAQLTHHNVVQIYDLGQDGGTNFFSMELVSGGSLDDQLKTKGKFPPKLAATLILQASRGLKFAHDHGMVHRDIKPANLMLTSDGMVKVADMGLVKTPNAAEQPADESDVQGMMLASARTQVTAIGSSMGTPAYMSPEQTLDATGVDKRADIYSLGCTFYALLTGKPPFDGKTLLEVISKHRMEKIVRPERIISSLPSVLGDIIEKMTEKKPDDRYQDLEEVIHDLEVYLELREDTSRIKIIHNLADSYATSSPSPVSVAASIPANGDVSTEHVDQLRMAAKRFNGSPLLLALRFAPMVWYGVCGLLCAVSILLAISSLLGLIAEGAKSFASQATAVIATDAAQTNSPTVSKSTQLLAQMSSRFKSGLGYLCTLWIAPLAVLAFAGAERRSPLALRWRESFIAGGIIEWAFWFIGATVALLAIHFFGFWIPAIAGTVFGVAAGATYYFGIEKLLFNARKPAIDQAQSTLRQLRLRGMDEQRIRDLTADQAGKNWEEFFESLFGYEAMRTMRTRLSQRKILDLQVFRPRRDKLIDRWDQRLADSRRQRDEKVLCRAEKAELVAAGVSEKEAGKRAETMAATLVDAASETRQTLHDIAAGKLTDQAAETKRQRIKQMMLEARSGKMSSREIRSRSLDRLLGQMLGSKFRFVCAGLLLLATGMWIQSNQKGIESYWQQARTTAQSTIDTLKQTTMDSKGLENATQALANATDQAKTAIAKTPRKEWNSVCIGLVTEKNVLFVGSAGLLMLWGSFLYGWKKSLVFVPLALLLCIVPGFL